MNGETLGAILDVRNLGSRGRENALRPRNPQRRHMLKMDDDEQFFFSSFLFDWRAI